MKRKGARPFGREALPQGVKGSFSSSPPWAINASMKPVGTPFAWGGHQHTTKLCSGDTGPHPSPRFRCLRGQERHLIISEENKTHPRGWLGSWTNFSWSTARLLSPMFMHGERLFIILKGRYWPWVLFLKVVELQLYIKMVMFYMKSRLSSHSPRPK